MLSEQNQSQNINSTCITFPKLYIYIENRKAFARVLIWWGICYFKGLAHRRLGAYEIFCI